jgi:hypothetical protein
LKANFAKLKCVDDDGKPFEPEGKKREDLGLLVNPVNFRSRDLLSSPAFHFLQSPPNFTYIESGNLGGFDLKYH